MAKRFLGNMDNDSYKNGYKVRSTKELRPTDKEMMVKGSRVLFSSENCGDEWLTLEGLFEGEMPCRDNPFIPLHEIELVDLCGNTISEEKLYSSDFHPDNIRFERTNEDEDVDDVDDVDDADDVDDVDDADDVDEWVCPDNGECYVYVYRNPNPPLHCVCQKKIPEYDERLDCLPKSESCSWHIACQKDGTHEPRSCLVKPRIPKADRYKNRRVKISPRRTDKLNEFLGDDTCYKTLLPQRVVVVVSQKQTKGKEKFCPLSSSVPIINKPKNEKIPKKRENNGYFNRPSMMRR